MPPTATDSAAEPWPPAWAPLAATAVGSMPGADPREAAALALGELDLPAVPELPGRGPGADLIGRTAALLAGVSSDLAVATTPTGWRLAGAPGRDARRAASYLGEDLDAVEQAAEGYRGPIKAALAGPWTLAAGVELPSGERVLRDPGACRDLVDALAAAAAGHVRDLRRRVPGAVVWIQLDEPSLPAVLAGGVPTASGFSRLRAPEPPVAAEALARVAAAVADAGGVPMAHCCAASPPYEVLAAAGLRALSVDLRLHDPRDDDAHGALLDAGVRLVLGAVPALPADPGSPSVAAGSVELVQTWAHRLGADLGATAEVLAVSPTCGLAGGTPASARAVVAAVREISRRLREAGA